MAKTAAQNDSSSAKATADKWEETILGKILKITMGQSPAGKNCNIRNKGLPLLNGPTEFNKHHPHPVQFTTDSKKIAEAGDLLFCVRGSTTGRMNWADQRYAIGRGVASLRHTNGLSLQPFLKAMVDYQLPSLLKSATGSTFPNISRDQLFQHEILLPSLPEQHAIAAVFSAFDEKIELLRKQNQTLKAIAQNIFKQWFVDFKFPGYEKVKMVDSELEKIPEGWRVGTIGELILDSIGGDYGKENVEDDFIVKTTCLRGTDLPDMKTNIPLKAPIRFLKESKINKCELVNGDIVIEISGGTENQSTGRSMYINEEILSRSNVPMTCVNFCRILRPKEISYSCFIYSYLDYLYNRGIFFNLENGTTGIKNLNLKSLLNKNEIPLPSGDFIFKFDSKIRIFFTKIQKNNSQIQTLSTLRDTLLPRLMRGDLRVRGAGMRVKN